MSFGNVMKNIWVGVKIALNVAVTLQEHGTIKIKELPKVADGITTLDKAIDPLINKNKPAGNPNGPIQ